MQRCVGKVWGKFERTCRRECHGGDGQKECKAALPHGAGHCGVRSPSHLAPHRHPHTQVTLRFCPDSLADFDDEFAVDSAEARFAVALQARRPPPSLTLPHELQMGDVLVGNRKVSECVFTQVWGRCGKGGDVLAGDLHTRPLSYFHMAVHLCQPGRPKLLPHPRLAAPCLVTGACVPLSNAPAFSLHTHPTSTGCSNQLCQPWRPRLLPRAPHQPSALPLHPPVPLPSPPSLSHPPPSP